MKYVSTLDWPPKIARAKVSTTRRTKRTWAMAWASLEKEVAKNKLLHVKVTANMNVQALSIHSTTGDQGVSVHYAVKKGKEYIHKCICCDRYRKNTDNLVAIVEVMQYYRKMGNTGARVVTVGQLIVDN